MIAYSQCSPEMDKLIEEIFNDTNEVDLALSIQLLPEQIKNKVIVLIPMIMLTRSVNIKKASFKILLDAADGDESSLKLWNKKFEIGDNKEDHLDQEEHLKKVEQQDDDFNFNINTNVKIGNEFFPDKYLTTRPDLFLVNSRPGVYMNDSIVNWTIKIAGKSADSGEFLYFITTNGTEGLEYLQISTTFYRGLYRRYVFTQNYSPNILMRTIFQAMWFIIPESDGRYMIKNALTDEYLYATTLEEKPFVNLVLLWIPKKESDWVGEENSKRLWKITPF